jgi:arylformamidase
MSPGNPRIIHDISLSIGPGLPVWPGDPAVLLERVAHLESDGCNLTRIAMGAHCGTHVDAPLHYLAEGAAVDRLDLEALVGPARVFDLGEAPRIDAATLAGLDWPEGLERALFRSERNGRLWDRVPGRFQRDFVAIDASGARWLVDRGLRCVGVDYLSVAPWDALEDCHRILLGAGVVPIEGLDLRRIAPGDYKLVCLPLKLEGADGAPARAILIQGD